MAISTVITAAIDNPTELLVPHYVPGRKLTSEDLQKERDTAQEHLKFIGRGVGTGIIEGLWVEAKEKNQLTISTGLGINRVGYPIALTGKATLNVVTPAAPNPSQQNTAFGPCTPSLAVNTKGLQDGPYLLTAVPVYQLSEAMTTVQKMVSRRANDDCTSVLTRGNNEDCTNKWEVEGINFRAVYLGQPDIPQGFPKDGVDGKKRRNLLAHWAYGTEQLLSQIRDPFQKWNDLNYTGFGIARVKFEAENDLTDCDLYLAVFYLSTTNNIQSIEWVDNWAVRRRLFHAFPFPLIAQNGGTAGFTGWSQRLNDQLAAEGEARFAQFQEHLDILRQKPNMASWAANQYFGYLPAAGYIPLLASYKLIKVISEYMVRLLEDEIKKSSANPQNSQLSTDNSISPLSTDTGHVTRDQMDGLIIQFNTVFTAMVSVANRLALTESLPQIYLPPIDKLKPNNFNDAVGTWEVDTNDHVLDTTFNGRLITAINERVTRLGALIAGLGVNFNVLISTALLPSVIGEPGIDNRLHLNVGVFNTSFIDLLNPRLTQMVTALNTIITGRSTAWTAVNNNLDQIMTDLQSRLQTRLSTTFVPSNNGVALESFFTKDSLTNASYVKYLAFTDRQTIETILENSWRAPAINLNVDQKLSLLMVYEDVIPDAVEQMKSLIETGKFSNQDSLYKVWSVDVDTVFNRIITNKSGSGKLPLYGLFTQAIYPLQMTVWQETAVISEPPPENNPPPTGGNNNSGLN